MIGETQQKPTRFFMPYFNHPNLAISIVAGNAFGRLTPRFKEDVFIIRDAWYPDHPESAVAAYRQIQEPYHDNLYFLSNTEEIHQIRLAHGFNSHFVNIGCFVDENVFTPRVDLFPKNTMP